MTPDDTNSAGVCTPANEPLPDEVGQSAPSLRNPPEDLFPLALTPVEKLMLVDDHVAYPRTFTVVLEFVGRLHQPAFEEAMLEVVRRNPLLSALVKKQQSKWHWVPTPFPIENIVWCKSEWKLNDRSIDLRKSPGFRASGHTDGELSQVHLSFHHAVTDGQGARRVILDWLTYYSALTAPESKKVPADSLNYERLRIRGQYVRAIAPKVARQAVASKSPGLWKRLRIIYDFLAQHPTPLRAGNPDPRLAKSNPNQVLTCRFDKDEVTLFRDRLRGTRITLNDVAIGLLLNAIAKWNRSHGETGRDRLYRILVPVDLRESGDELLPATNRLSFVFISRPTSLCLDFPRMISTIRSEMDYIEEHGAKYNFVNAMSVVHSIPGALRSIVRIPVCLSTAILTNLGDTVGRLRHRFPQENRRPIIGNLHYIRSLGVPPLRPKTRLGIGMTISLGELVIQGQFDPRAFCSTDATEFMQLIKDNWRNWVEGTPEFQD